MSCSLNSSLSHSITLNIPPVNNVMDLIAIPVNLRVADHVVITVNGKSEGAMREDKQKDEGICGGAGTKEGRREEVIRGVGQKVLFLIGDLVKRDKRMEDKPVYEEVHSDSDDDSDEIDGDSLADDEVLEMVGITDEGESRRGERGELVFNRIVKAWWFGFFGFVVALLVLGSFYFATRPS
jgi:hypothetical protein